MGSVSWHEFGQRFMARIRARTRMNRLPVLVLLAWQAAVCLGDELNLEPLGAVRNGDRFTGAAEIVAHDPDTQRLFVTNGQYRSVDIVDIKNPARPRLIKRTRALEAMRAPTSVAVRNGLLAIAVPALESDRRGRVVFADVDGTTIDQVQVGYLPDMLCFSPDSGKETAVVYVANEGEPSPDYSVDPPGSISVITIQRTAGDFDFTCQEILLDRYPMDPEVRIFGPGAMLATNLEPEYIAVGENRLWVALQENNALVTIDRRDLSQGRIISCGFKNHGLAGCGLDPSDQDVGIQIRPWNIFGMYQPDSIATFRVGGKDYLVTANEGDPRDFAAYRETGMVGELNLDARRFPDRQRLQRPENLGRLNVSRRWATTITTATSIVCSRTVADHFRFGPLGENRFTIVATS